MTNLLSPSFTPLNPLKSFNDLMPFNEKKKSSNESILHSSSTCEFEYQSNSLWFMSMNSKCGLSSQQSSLSRSSFSVSSESFLSSSESSSSSSVSTISEEEQEYSFSLLNSVSFSKSF